MKGTLHLILTEGLNDCLNQLGYALTYAKKNDLRTRIYTNEAKILFPFESVFELRKSHNDIRFMETSFDVDLCSDYVERDRNNQLPPSAKNIIWKEAGGGLKSAVAFDFLKLNNSLVKKVIMLPVPKLCVHIRSTDHKADLNLIDYVALKADDRILLLSDNRDLLCKYYNHPKFECNPQDIEGALNKPHHATGAMKNTDRDIVDLLRLSFAKCSISSPIRSSDVPLTEQFSGYYLLALLIKFSSPAIGKPESRVKLFIDQIIGILIYGHKSKITLIKLNIYIFLYSCWVTL